MNNILLLQLNNFL